MLTAGTGITVGGVPRTKISIFLTTILLLAIIPFGTAAQSPTAVSDNTKPNVKTPDPVSLAVGGGVEREIAGEQKHSYKIEALANQYIHITVAQKNVDVALLLTAPNGSTVVEVDSPTGRAGTEEIKTAIGEAGDYNLEIKAVEKGAPAGGYVARFVEQRAATDTEIISLRANLIHDEGIRLRDQRTAATLKQAIPKFETAAQLSKQIGEKRNEAIAMHDLALTRQLLGESALAIEIYKQAINIALDGKDYKTAGTATNNIGFIYFRTADYQKSLFYFRRALEIHNTEELGPYRTPALANIAGIYKTIGEPEKSIDYFNEALANTRKYGQKNSESSVLLNLAAAYSDFGDHQKSLKMQLDSLPYWRGRKDHQGEILALGYIADDYFYLNDYVNALGFFNQQMELSTPNDREGIARSSFGLGKTYSRLGQPDKALENLSRALSLYDFDARAKSLVLLWMAGAEKRAGRFAKAEEDLRQAIEAVESVRNRISTQNLRTAFFSKTSRDIYDAYISLLMEMHRQDPTLGYDTKAFAVSEKSRARSLLELLAVSQVDIRQGVDEKLLSQEKAKIKELSDKAAQVTKLVIGKASEEAIAAARADYSKTEDEFQQTENLIRSGNPHYAALTQPQTVSLDETQKNLLDSDTALLEYSLGAEKSFLWVATNNSFQAVELPGRAELEKASRNIHALMNARNKTVKFETVSEKQTRVTQADTDLKRELAALGDAILPTAVRKLSQKRLLIVPDGALFYVPFAALPISKADNGKTSSLISEFEIVSLPSVSTLGELRKASSNRVAPSKTLAVFADPVFDKNDERFRSDKKAGPENRAATRGFEEAERSDLNWSIENNERGELSLGRLPFTRIEARQISSVVAASQNKLSMDFSASRKSALDADLANYRIIHFATHSFISANHPETSGIVLSMIDQDGNDEDGFVRANDIYNTKLPADLVVLSGCKTGVGKEMRGEGLVGLTQSFMYAGASRVLVSLWDVNDEATAELMTRFYREMLSGKKLAPSAALRQAQISLLKDKRWQNPYFWAAFTLQGEPK